MARRGVGIDGDSTSGELGGWRGAAQEGERSGQGREKGEARRKREMKGNLDVI